MDYSAILLEEVEARHLLDERALGEGIPQQEILLLERLVHVDWGQDSPLQGKLLAGSPRGLSAAV